MKPFNLRKYQILLDRSRDNVHTCCWSGFTEAFSQHYWMEFFGQFAGLVLYGIDAFTLLKVLFLCEYIFISSVLQFYMQKKGGEVNLYSHFCNLCIELYNLLDTDLEFDDHFYALLIST